MSSWEKSGRQRSYKGAGDITEEETEYKGKK